MREKIALDEKKLLSNFIVVKSPVLDWMEKNIAYKKQNIIKCDILG